MNYAPHAIVEYAFTAALLVLNLLLLWIFSGVARAKSGRAVNAEDGRRSGVPVEVLDPPMVARVLRAHANAAALTYPFLVLGLVHVLLNGDPRLALITYAVFVVSRVAHSIAYVRGAQPWRSLFFVLSLLALLILLGSVVVRALHVYVLSQVS